MRRPARDGSAASLLLLVATGIAVPAAAEEEFHRLGVAVDASYGLAHNHSPLPDVAGPDEASSPAVAVGVGLPGSHQALLAFMPLWAHGDGTTSEMLFELSVRVAPPVLAGAFVRASLDVSPGTTLRPGEELSTPSALAGGSLGYARARGPWDFHLELGARAGRHRLDGFVVFSEIRFGVGYTWALDHLQSRSLQ
jgi:hypothetical protein